MLYYFYGVELNKAQLNGKMLGKDIIRNFGQDWIPAYQRDRVRIAKKVNSLIRLFKTGGQIPPVTLNFIGKAEFANGEAILDGKFHVVDGQQRLWALLDSRAEEYQVPVQLYINLPYEKEVELFHQQQEATRLTFADFASSIVGPIADEITKIRANRSFPVQVVKSGGRGMALHMFSTVYYWMLKRMMFDHDIVARPNRQTLLRMYSDKAYAERDIERVTFAVKNMLNFFSEIFGLHNPDSLAWSRGFFLAMSHVLIDNFMDTRTGKPVFRNKKGKLETLPQLLKDSKLRELIAASGGPEEPLYDLIIGHLNYKCPQDTRLKTLGERHGRFEEDENRAVVHTPETRAQV